MDHLKIKSFGPIADADVRFGDLTVLVGPQASGKSIFLQLLKLVIDKRHIRKIFQQYNFVWGKDPAKILNHYFGEEMAEIWRPNSTVQLNGRSVTTKSLLPESGGMRGTDGSDEKLFYIPAQRILSVSDGRPKTFMEFEASTPYVLRQFSDTLRQMLQNEMGNVDSIFPVSTRLKEPLQRAFEKSIFHSGKVEMKNINGQRKLRMKIGEISIPFITWSAGQKEFMPLLLGFYWLCPSSKTKSGKKKALDYVVIEEPEMGLHPEAISAILLQVIDLLARGYKVIISTHSPVLLELGWAMNYIQKHKGTPLDLFHLFDLPKSPSLQKVFEAVIKHKKFATYYFEQNGKGVHVKDISSLDAGSEDAAVSDWGGISEFAGRAGDVVSKLVSDEI